MPAHRSPTYKASVALAIVFMALAVSLPFWLDRVRQPVDRSVLDRDLSSVQAIPGAGPRTFVPPPPQAVTGGRSSGASASASALGATGTRGAAVNADCRAYVYARCNALRIPASDCLPIALDAMRAPLEGGMSSCHDVVDVPLKAAAQAAGAVEGDDAAPAGGASPSAVPAGQVPPGDMQKGGTGAVPASGQGKPVPVGPGDAAAAKAAAPGASALSPAQRAEKLQRVLGVLEELQRGGNNYATLPAAQDARLAEIRALVEAEGSDEAKALYNGLVRRYQAAPPPEAGGTVGESPREEAGMVGTAPSSTDEMDQVRKMMNGARHDAGLPAEAAPDPAAATRAQSTGEAPAAQEYRP